MTKLYQTRLQCDYCNNVSPVIEDNKKPRGWVTAIKETRPFKLPNAATVHFCCSDHHYEFVLQEKVL